MMERWSLQFQGARDQQLLLMVLGAISAVLLATGIWHLARRRVRHGLIALGAALGPPAIVPVLLGDAAVRYLRQSPDGRTGGTGAGGPLLAAGAIAAASIAGLGLMAAAGDSGAFWTAAVGIHVATAVGVFYSSVYAYLGTRRMLALMALRCLAILALLLLLFKPAMSLTIGADDAKPFLPILLDRSGSMSTIDEAGAGDRYAQALAMLHSQSQRITRSFRPVYYCFGESPALAESLEALGEQRNRPAGPGSESTNIAAAIKSVATDYRRQGGMILLSDGLHNAANARVMDAVVEAGMPIYTVGVGSAVESTAARRNVQLLSVTAPVEVVKNNVANVSVQLRLSGLAGAAPAGVQLFEGLLDQPVVTAQVPAPRKNDDKAAADLKWTPRAASAASGPAEQFASQVRRLRITVPPVPGESNTDDNSAELHVLVTEPRIRVLYVEGSMRPEYKYLKRLLETDTNVQFMGLVRVSGNKFWAQGGIGGRTLNALPATDDEFSLFDVIIIGDLDQTFLTRDQMARVRAFVNNGGGLLMLGGHNALGPGGYGQTPIEEALPVTLGPRSQPQEATPLVPMLTALGESHPIFDGIAGFFSGPGGRAPKSDLPKLPELSGCVSVVGPKPGASVLAAHPSRQGPNGPLIILAVEQFGGGRSAVFSADTTWNWYMPLRGLGGQSPYAQFWGQLIRWLANTQTKTREAPPQVLLRTDQCYLQTGQPVQISAYVRDPKTASAQQRVECSVTGPDGKPQTLALAPGREAGLFQGSWQSDKAGKYRLKATASDATGRQLGSDELPLIVAPHSAEMDRLARDQATLEQIAKRSDGRYVDLSRMPEMIDELIARQKAHAAPGPQTRNFPLYNFAWLFILFGALVTTEWVLRRNWQLH